MMNKLVQATKSKDTGNEVYLRLYYKRAGEVINLLTSVQGRVIDEEAMYLVYTNLNVLKAAKKRLSAQI